jgi:hypothetical protein
MRHAPSRSTHSHRMAQWQKPNVPKFLPAYQKAAKITAAAGEQQELFGS